MDDLIAFMQARLAEDVRGWKLIWRFKHGDRRVDGWWDLGGTFGGLVHSLTDTTRGGREIAAKRKRLELYIQAAAELRRFLAGERTDLVGKAFAEAIHKASARYHALHTAVRLDAYVFADHKDYDERWKLDV